MDTILSMSGIDKSFKGVHALKEVTLDLAPGEVHAIAGENGAGKSTLMKILTGIETADAGQISYLNLPFIPKGPGHAQRLGIGMIHQELNLMDNLTVAQNVYFGRESRVLGGLLISDQKQREKTQSLFNRLHINIDPDVRVETLSVGKQQMVEIAKTVSNRLKVLVLDEPTAALTDREIDDLFRIVKDLTANGVAMIYISHRLQEIFQIADRVTVLRDGQRVDTRAVRDVTRNEIVQMMVGRTIYEDPKEQSSVAAESPTVIRVRNLNAGAQVRDVSFDLHRGEILGFSGLIGSGRTETARAIFGADPIDSGSIEVNGRPRKIRSPKDAVAIGIGYLSEDRKRYGLSLKLSVSDNVVLSSYDEFSRGPFVDFGKVARTTKRFVERLQIRTPSIYQVARNLSGGNQQKVVIAKWLVRNCDVLILDEPTRGIDVGAKGEIYSLMNELVAEGKSISMISSELPEVLRMSDRIAVMCEGRITGVLDIREATQESIMQYATMRDTGVTADV